ncbi:MULTISPECIES: 3-hydroxy-fatty acyl-ACP dehydratase [unclassified Gilliamella]|uniref:ApeP family dehydratase n=1 Tax=unclassified Gilliamella TaxID=2685620 RepID=UPI002269F052|nr:MULTISPECIES: 3-hydroxy-fatty acyl-ACP dehydratase [unclassified Gilliamella]MCX8573714.1 3-hydroxy-fatty acyl-ACP dehydratase [Gilliamella sp. B3831]MCX8575658.1 3-hydroxy-fatty acyl-ACP dehydratase [Gilliamella sp. B3815]MCX8589859.1 3-hydroxy-fatty acyl-ACP dehydratase [Gilliamella sp. B3812]MCX8602760.1 3-hydroxy-fatty acyl-ACP dehydratase [Gilliamella sp. B3823]MCX8605057.1 3-hydroxy-fatty acyl-ACP dehydratase [Gilliamella sp. B3825]
MQYHLASYYLPHEKPMVMIEKVHFVDAQQCICSIEVNKQGILSPFLNEDDTLPNFYAIELMAQTIGVWNGYHGMVSDKKPTLGMLLGGRAIKSTLDAFPCNSHLMIHANLVLNDAKLANFECKIMINQEIVTTGKLNVYEPDECELDNLFGQQRFG